MNLAKFLAEQKLTLSFAESRRLVGWGIVKINGQVVRESSTELKKGDIVEVREQKFTFDGGQQ